MFAIKLLMLTLALLLPAAPQAQMLGTITGTVVDQQGKPVEAVRVQIGEVGRPAVHRFVRFYETDNSGNFAITDVPWGTYMVTTWKEEDGYPNTAFLIYATGLPAVTLSESEPKATVRIVLEPKAGALDPIIVTDAETGDDISRIAVITIRTARDPSGLTRSAAGEHLLVPPGTDVSIEISAPGYKSWPSEDDLRGTGKVRLKPDETVELRVKLKPDPAATAIREARRAQAAAGPCHPSPPSHHRVPDLPPTGVRLPEPVHHAKAEYTEEARAAGCEGLVTVAVLVGADGNVQDANVLYSLDAGLDQKAVEAVRRWKFKPGTKDGQPAPIETTVMVEFRLH